MCALAHFTDLKEHQDSLDYLLRQIAYVPASVDQCANFVDALGPGRESVLEDLLQRARDAPDARKRARYAAVSLALGDARAAREMLAVKADPQDRSAFIQVFETWHGNLNKLPEVVRQTPDPAFRSGICCAVGSLDPAFDLSGADQTALLDQCEDLYLHDPDAATHSAAGWAVSPLLAPSSSTAADAGTHRSIWLAETMPRGGLSSPLRRIRRDALPDLRERIKRIGRELPWIPPSEKIPEGQHWFKSRLTLTLLEVPPGTFQMGAVEETGALDPSASPSAPRMPFVSSAPPWRRHAVTLSQSLFMLDKEIPDLLFRACVHDASYAAAERPPAPAPDRMQDQRDLARAADGVSWTDAVLCCNWLSHKEGRKPCYRRTGKKLSAPAGEGVPRAEWDEWACDFSANGFLNGCSTRPQVARLLAANVAAVIATDRAINDGAALTFAVGFYTALISGRIIRQVFEESSGAASANHGSNLRHVSVGNAHVDPLDEPGLPWRPGAGLVERWKLSAHNPLDGLPPLDKDVYRPLPASPFRHLDRFLSEHARLFFGRGHAIRELYDLVTSPGAAIILYHGQTGVGKSSVLEAGLLPRLTRYQVLSVRRDHELDLLGSLAAALAPGTADFDLAAQWLGREAAQVDRPLLVILDQAEEAFTRPPTATDGSAFAGPQAEVRELARALRATFSRETDLFSCFSTPPAPISIRRASSPPSVPRSNRARQHRFRTPGSLLPGSKPIAPKADYRKSSIG